jgi:hypothetical protein
MTVDNWINLGVAIGTIVLAIATIILAIAAYHSIKENRRIRDEDREIDFKSKSLDEIYEWANNLYHAVVNSSSPNFRHKMEIELRLRNTLSNVLSIQKLTHIYGEKMESQFDKVTECYKKFESAIYDENHEIRGGFLDPNNKEHKAVVSRTISSLYDLMELISETKIKLLLREK